MAGPEIGVIYGDRGLEMADRLLHKLNIGEKLSLRNASVGIKPNLVLPKTSEKGATTDPQIVAGIIEYVKSFGPAEIKIMESSWVGASTEQAFNICGYRKLAEKYDVNLVNLKRDNLKTFSVGREKIKVCQQAAEVDILINVPVLKAHCQTKMTCALKNLKGCIPDAEKRRYHREGLHKPIALLNKVLSSDLIVVDGIYGDLTFEEGGNPVKMDRVFAGLDPVLVDSYAAHLLALEPAEIGYLEHAVRLGLGSNDLAGAEINEINTPVGRSNPGEQISEIAERLSQKYIKNKSACSACYGNLIQALHRLDESGDLGSFSTSICIGQDFRGQKKECPGIGNCTAKFSQNVSGCPPTASEIVDFFQNKILDT
ncbi:MAG: DUF362 domain-containing protein [Bacillota bacterium]